MALKRKGNAKESTAVEYDKLGEGEFDGRLVYVADLGLQEGMMWKGVQKDDTQQLSLGIEIVGNHVTIDGKQVPRILWTQPFNVFRTLTEKGREIQMYNVFGKGVIGEEADWDAALGQPCNVKVIAKSNKEGDKVFDNIESLGSIPTKFQDKIEKNELEPCIGDSDDPENEATKALFGLAKWVFDKRIKEENSDNPYA
ncbi:MAG: hypothetical protein GQ474_07965 [Sulfurimonas sp.]|nr:hypothetical protein [Sulfurimonas sp.]